ncbi:MAG: serine/threonine protein kinase [Myxococcota bacterium]
MESLGRYRLLKLLATGGMGEVFLARHEGPAGFSKTVVIKRILRHLASDQGFIDLFLNEARLAAQLQHPNIAQVFGLEHEADTWFIAMEYVHGRSLREVLSAAKQHGLKVPPRLAARIASQALHGLHFAHELTDAKGRPLGILHRDVSPENLLVAFSGTVKLVDFGIAKAMGGEAARVGRPKGKISYMAPELTFPGAEVDRRADVYAMGMVLAEMLLLERPPNSPRTVEEARGPRQPWASVPSLPAGLDAILARALCPEREGRFETAAAMSEALEGWLVSTGQTVVPGDLMGFLQALFGEQALEENAGVALEQSLGTTGVISVRRSPGGTQPLSMPVLPPVKASHERLPPVAPPDERRQLFWPVVIGSATALLLGFVLLLSLWPRRAPDAVEDIPLVAVGPDDLMIPEFVIPSEVQFEAEANEADAIDAGAPSAPPRPRPQRRVAKTGRVSVRVNPWAEVLYGGKSLGTTPIPPVEVPAGTASFVLRNQQLGVTRKVSVKVPAGSSVVLKADLFKK